MNEYNLTRVVNSVLLVVVICAILLCVAAYSNMTQTQVENYARHSIQQNTQEISREVNVFLENAQSIYLYVKGIDK